MTKHFIFIISSILLILSCSETNDKQPKAESSQSSKIKIAGSETDLVQVEKESDQTIDLSASVELFIEEVLKEHQRRHEMEPETGKIQHLELFESKGLEEVLAFSDQRYPKRSEPYYYEHFILFALKYKDIESAEDSYTAIKKLAQIIDDTYDESEGVEKARLQRIMSSIKAGGMICRKANYVFSLVKTCREPPIGGKWEAYENLFLSFIRDAEEEMIVLTAKCGQMNYSEEIR